MRYFFFRTITLIILLSASWTHAFAVADNQHSANVLMVVSGHGQLQGEEQPGYEFSEFAKAYLVFKAHNISVDVASPNGGPVGADQYDPNKAFNAQVLADSDIMAKLDNTLIMSSVDANEYDALFVVGGKGAMFDLPKDKALQHDAYVRLGDVHFASGNYWPAMEAYNKALAMQGFNNDYAFFQKAISYGFVDRNNRKIDDLSNFLIQFTSSPYRDNALYELANTYSAENNQLQALNAYQKIIDEHPNSVLKPRALSKKGLIFYNANQNEKALNTLKQLVANYPNSEQAAQAVNTVRLIYIDQGKPETYAAWVNNLDFVDLADSDVDNATFESAEKPFLSGNNQKAILGFKKYINQFPKGIHSLKANFYLAQLLYNQGDKQESLAYFKEVIEASTSEFTETALSRSAQVYLEEKNYTEAIPILKQLETKAQFTQNVVFAVSNLMKAYYHTENFEETITYASKVKDLKSVEERAVNDAYLFSARAYMKIDRENEAEEAYAIVQESATGKLAAEAIYYDAYFKHRKGEFQASTEAVKKLTKNYSRFKEFGFKGLIIMAKNYYALDDAFNATYILESLEKSATAYPEILTEVKAELYTMKQEIAQKNSSVEVEATQETDSTKTKSNRVIKF